MRINGRREQVPVLHAEHPHQEKHLVFPDAVEPAFQLGHRAPRYVPSGYLQFGGQLALGPVPIHPQSANLRPDDVVD